MRKIQVGVCHRNRLFSECLATSLCSLAQMTCRTFLPENVVSTITESVDISALDLLLLDSTLPDDLSIRVAELVRCRSAVCKLLLLVPESAVGRMVELAQFVGDGCLYEEVPLINVSAAIETVLSGQSFCSPELANALMAQIGRRGHQASWSQHMDDVQLTSREREVLELIAWENLGNKQIARRLEVSLYTVKNHVHNILEKLGVADRHDAVHHARQRKLLVGDRSGSGLRTLPR